MLTRIHFLPQWIPTTVSAFYQKDQHREVLKAGWLGAFPAFLYLVMLHIQTANSNALQSVSQSKFPGCQDQNEPEGSDEDLGPIRRG